MRRAAAEQAIGGVVGPLPISACCDMYTYPVSSLLCAVTYLIHLEPTFPVFVCSGLGHQRMSLALISVRFGDPAEGSHNPSSAHGPVLTSVPCPALPRNVNFRPKRPIFLRSKVSNSFDPKQLP